MSMFIHAVQAALILVRMNITKEYQDRSTSGMVSSANKGMQIIN